MELGRANAEPTKAFFVRMLTRDISLEDCILDLIDNSVDSAWRSSGDRPSSFDESGSLETYQIEVEFTRGFFSITDNCGGLSLDDAANYAFTFGRRDDDVEKEDEAFSVGVYGIGMKRAIFKLGNEILITSTVDPKDDNGSFRVPINVSNWLSQENGGSWDFSIEEAQPLPSNGLKIEVTQLPDPVDEKFDDVSFQNSLRRTISHDYLIPLRRGLRIIVNGVQVPTARLQFRHGEEFAPLKSAYTEDGVAVELIAGMRSLPPEDDGPEQPGRSDDISGWYVICNGRAVLSADRTAATGWGSGQIPKWHSQYGGFLGIVFFAAADPSLLPMTTTKRSVDASSGLYRRALARMSEPTRAWVDYTNERKADLETAKEREAKTTSSDPSALPEREKVELPKPVSKTTKRVANIMYQVELERLRSLADALGDIGSSYRDVGKQSFEFAFEQLVEEDE